jgi:FkbM family methyltransferase
MNDALIAQEEIARLPVTRTLFAYEGRVKRFAGYPSDWAVDEIAYGLPAPHANRGRIYRAVREGTLAEVGAHIGTTTLVASDFFNHVYAFEPASRNFALLGHNIKLNDAKNITAVQMAVSEHPGEENLYLCGDDKAVCHSLSSGVARTGTSERVMVTTLDKHLTHVKDCTMLLVDAEGHDMKVLRGGRTFIERNHPLIVIEFAPQFWLTCGSNSCDLVAFAESLGYRICADFGNNFSPVSPAMLHEMFRVWSGACQAWLDLYLVPFGRLMEIFP